MSEFTVEAKSQLAKLMATENLSVQHKKISTAKFDLKNRILFLPIWKETSGYTYDHLVGHEVGHALYTPIEGWHDSVTDKKGVGYKSFLNVIEDARIEKKIQRRYPGLRQSFKKSFESLFEKDFFGIKNRDINTLSLINRINLFTKSQYTLDVDFDEHEIVFVSRAKQLESWEDVVKLTDEIYEYSKQEQNQAPQSIYDDHEFFNSSDEDQDDNDPICETDNNYRRNEASLLDESCKPYTYIELPTPNLDNIVTPAKKVHEQLAKYYDSLIARKRINGDNVNKLVADFKQKNDRYVNLLVKEFEMKKAARNYSKSKVSETGDIDITKLASYKFDENIFKRLTVTPNGKSHGLVLLLDLSSSMVKNIDGSIEQIIILSMFCRKVNIPFVVYGFNNHPYVRIADFGVSQNEVITYPEKFASFSKNTNEIYLGDVKLREYLNSSMTNSQFSKCVRNLILLKNGCANQGIYYPVSETLHKTPMIAALVAIQPIIKKFKKTNGTDVNSLVIVHDGDADENKYYFKDSTKQHWLDQTQFFDLINENVFIVDTKSKYQKKIEYSNFFDSRGVAVAEILFDWIKETTKTNIIGFYILGKGEVKNQLYRKYMFSDGTKLNSSENYNKKDALSKNLKKEHFLQSFNKGYNAFFFVVGGNDLKVHDEKLEITGKMTTNKLKNSFMKSNKSKQISRVLVNKFIENIVSH